MIKYKLIIILFTLITNITYSQNSCACIFYNTEGIIQCTQGNCGNSNFQNCLNRINPTWYQAVQPPAGMTICEYILNQISLPIELYSFTVNTTNVYNRIEWLTASESNNDYFIIERSADGINWEIIYKINGAGNSTSNIKYEYYDYNFINEINYYRLTQIDFNGQSETFGPISIDNRNNMKLIKTLNMLGQEVDNNATGVLFEVYDNGIIKKIIR
jgi:hypothetical protein